jgi:hypothetical protein
MIPKGRQLPSVSGKADRSILVDETRRWLQENLTSLNQNVQHGIRQIVSTQQSFARRLWRH